MAREVTLRQENLRILRTQYFHFTLEFVERHTGVSTTTIRNAEIGRKIKKENLNKIFVFYIKADDIKQYIRNHPEEFKNVR